MNNVSVLMRIPRTRIHTPREWILYLIQLPATLCSHIARAERPRTHLLLLALTLSLITIHWLRVGRVRWSGGRQGDSEGAVWGGVGSDGSG